MFWKCKPLNKILMGRIIRRVLRENSSKTNHGYLEKILSNLFRKAKREASEEDFGLGAEKEFIEWAVENFEEKLRIAKP